MEDLERIDLVCRFGQDIAMQFHDDTDDAVSKQYYTGLYMAYAAVRECVRILKKNRGDDMACADVRECVRILKKQGDEK